MNPFSIGERVYLRFCPGPAGTITALVRGKVHVCFDDFRNEPAKAFRPESLQRLVTSQAPCVRLNVPKTSASGTQLSTASEIAKSSVWRDKCAKPFGTTEETKTYGL
jgi:hypothetical protein